MGGGTPPSHTHPPLSRFAPSGLVAPLPRNHLTHQIAKFAPHTLTRSVSSHLANISLTKQSIHLLNLYLVNIKDYIDIFDKHIYSKYIEKCNFNMQQIAQFEV